MNMKRFLITVLVLALFLSACQSKPKSSKPETKPNTATSETEKPQENENQSVSFYACPDNLLHPSLYYDGIRAYAEKNGTTPNYSDLQNASYDFSHFYEFIADDIKNADISYINQESMIGGSSRAIQGYPRFNTPSAMADTLANLGFDIVNIAHNHMLDCGVSGIEYSNELFSSKGVNVLGYYPNADATEDIMIIERKGIKIAFLSYTYSTNGIGASKDSEIVIPYFEKALIEKQVAIAKEKADFIIASCHWGNEYSYNVNSMQKEYASYLCELGVDVLLGMHPHCIQPVEWLTSQSGHKTLAVYSLGTMISGIRKGGSALAGILKLNIVKDGKTGDVHIDTPQFVPTVAHFVWSAKYVADDDTASREFKVYYLSDYTEELAKNHAIIRIEKREGTTTLVGGGFSLENLNNTVNKYIPQEFLPK